jgi:hypothetical protein
VAYTKWLVKYVLALRREMSISAVAKFTGLHWESVKESVKRYLATANEFWLEAVEPDRGGDPWWWRF